MNATEETPKRQRFLADCAPWTEIGMADFFIRGYDDRQCGRPRECVYVPLARDAYAAGWNAYIPYVSDKAK